MSNELNGISERMRELGLAALAHANRHAVYWNNRNTKWAELSIIQAAHAAEILFKAKIAEKDYKLIFRNYSKLKDVSLEILINDGKTIDWKDIPKELNKIIDNALTVDENNQFIRFGYIRNSLQHFGIFDNSLEPSDEALRFIFGVIDPFINRNWGLYAIDFDEDEDPYRNIPGILLSRNIDFLVSPQLREYRNNWENGRIDIYGPLFPKDQGDYMDYH